MPDLAAAELVAEVERHARHLRKQANLAIAAAQRGEQEAEAIRRSFERVMSGYEDASRTMSNVPIPPKLEVVPALPGTDEHYEEMFAKSDFLNMSRLDVIVHVLRHEKRGMGSAEIHALMIAGGRSDKIERVRNAMYDLHVRGRVAKLGRGKWTVPELESELATPNGMLENPADSDADFPGGEVGN